SAAQKKVIDDHCTPEWALKVASPWADFEHAGIAKIKAEAGQEVYEPTPAQVADWKKAAQPLEEKWAENVKKAGVDPATVMKELKAELFKGGAGLGWDSGGWPVLSGKPQAVVARIKAGNDE